MKKYQTPFKIIDGIIYDAAGAKVKLWGVNYYAPFNHNYFNLLELGKDHFSAIDEDIKHLKLLKVDFLRMHMFEREITTFDGRLVENHQMEVFDYLVDQCEKHGIYLMISPISYWNTVKNQILMEQQYAYWNIYSQDAFGFTNFYSVDSLIWHPEAQNCQERYLNDLFARKNKFSGKRLNDYSNIVAWELINEPRFPDKSLLEDDPEITSYTMSAATKSRGALRKEFQDMFREFQQKHSGRDFSQFRRQIINDYLNRFWGMVREYFGDRVIRAQFMAYSGIPDAELKTIMEENSYLDANSIGTYLNVDGFDSANTDSANHLTIAKAWFDRFAAGEKPKKLANVSYEFGATGTINGYPQAAIAAMYAGFNVQMAAFFTYTPYGVAAWNPGWLVHFLNIAHTPAKAAGFAAAGEIFRSHDENKLPLAMEENKWSGMNFSIERENDFVCFKDEHTFCYSSDNDLPLENPASLTYVAGRGNSRFACSESNGIYILEKAMDNRWKLAVFPTQRYLGEPGRGRSFKGMANRYVNCLKEPPVSQLSENTIDFRLKTCRIVSCVDINGKQCEVFEDNTIRVKAGEYILEVNS